MAAAVAAAARVLRGGRMAAAVAAAARVLRGGRMAVMGSSSKLPVKTLKRNETSFCKSMSTLISSPQPHRVHHKSPLLLTLMADYNSEETPILRFSAHDNQGTLVKEFSTKATHHYYRPFIQSCRGLVCLTSSSPFSVECILICNPTTEEIISLPPTQEPSCSVGFGFAASTREFKVVRFFFSRDRYGYGWENRCQVFTLGTTRWREVSPPPYDVFQGCAPFFDGDVHFLRRIPNPGRVEKTDRVGAFDMDTEEYREGVLLPQQYYNLGDCDSPDILITRDFLRLSKLGGSLCLTFDYGEMKCRLDMWLLKDYDNAEWINRHTIDVSPLYPYPSYCFKGYPVDTMGDDVLLSCTDEEGVNLLAYDPRDGTVKVKMDNMFAATYCEGEDRA